MDKDNTQNPAGGSVPGTDPAQQPASDAPATPGAGTPPTGDTPASDVPATPGAGTPPTGPAPAPDAPAEGGGDNSGTGNMGGGTV